MKHLALVIAVSMFGTSWAYAQSDRDRAQSAIDALPGIESELTQGNMEATVRTFTTATPPETQLDHTEFQDEQNRIQYENSDTGNAFTAAKDSVIARPSIELPDDPLALADDAIDQADSVVGGLFSSSGGVCSQDFQGGRFQGTQFCRKLLSRTYENCTQDRIVTVDREDDWRCDTETNNYIKTCNVGVSWRCNGYTGQACKQRALLWSGYSGSWINSSTARVTLPARGGGCVVKTDRFYVKRKDFLDNGALQFRTVHFNGRVQIRINGANVYTWGGPNSNLNIRDRDCGKNCSVRAIYAGSTHLEDCTSARRSVTPALDLYRYLSVANPGPSTESGLSIGISQGKESGWVTIDVVRANSAESAPLADIYSTGNCCSSFAASVGGSC